MERTPDTNQTTDKIPHSGNLPGELRETPINNFDNTPLSDAPLNEINIQDVLPTEVLPVAEKKKSKKGLLIGASAGLAGVALVAGSIIGINAANSGEKENEAPAADPRATTEVEPITEAGPSEGESDPIREYLADIESLDVEDFVQLPQEEQLKYSRERLIQTNLYELIDDISWTEPALDNSAQQIYDSFRYARNTATIQQKPSHETGELAMNPTEGIKLLSGAFDNTFDANLMPGMQNYEERKEFILERDTPYVNTAPTVATNFSENDTLTKNNQEVVYRDILINDSSYETVGRFIYRTFTDINGEEQGAWLLDSIRDPDTAIPE